MQILDYNRIVKDLGGRNPAQFLSDLEQEFTVQAVADHGVAKPDRAGQFGMYVGGQWYLLTAREVVTDSDDPVNSLDVSLLQRQILEPMLGIGDQRTDKRIDFVGGIRGLGELQKRVDSGQWAVAFALFPTSIESLMAIADAGEVMPPKSTWFEPKLKSGLIIHVLD